MHRSLPLVFIYLFSPVLLADTDSDPSLEYKLESAYKYDSNLDIDALDRSANTGDGALITKAAVNGRWQTQSGFGVSGGYQVSSDDYQSNDAFDTLTQIANADLHYTKAAVTVGASYHYADAALDKDDFLVLQQSSVYVGTLLSDKWYLRAAWTDQDKDFATLNDYDADNRALSGALYHFYTPQSFVSLSLAREDEDALNKGLDYSGWRSRLQWTHSTQWFALPTELHLTWQHRLRDYDNSASLTQPPDSAPLGKLFSDSTSNSAGAQAREDNRDSLGLKVETSINSVLRVVGSLEYNDNHSNLESADYDEVVSTLGLNLVF